MVQRSVTARRAPSTKAGPARPEGVIRAIVAVTGTEDEVGDIITPGIFARTLAKRRPKVVFHHKFDDFAGRILHIEEWMPGDRRLPAQQPNGSPWPVAAGALVATMQFNLKTQRGREVYEWARFYAESGESAWSIGYTVPPGMSAKRGGVRVIYGIDLFEISLVLHGAHPMTMALEVKSAAALVSGARTLEVKAAPATAPLPAGDVESTHQHDGIMVALFPPREVADALAVPGGEPADELHVTLALLGDGPSYSAEDVITAVRQAVADSTPLSGHLGGLGMFPDSGNGAPVWAPVDVPGLESLRERIVTALDEGATSGAVRRDHGYTPHMTLGYDLPSVTPVPSTAVAFGRVTVVDGDERTDVDLPGAPVIETKGDTSPIGSPGDQENWVDQTGGLPTYIREIAHALIRNGHSESTAIATAVASVKRWAAGGDDVHADTQARAAAALAEWESKKAASHVDDVIETNSPSRAVEVKAGSMLVEAARATTLTPMETKMARMPGSLEERTSIIKDELNRQMRPKKKDGLHCGWLSVEATFDTHVVVSVWKDDAETADTFDIDYQFEGDHVILGKRTPVELELVAVPEDGGAPDPAPVDETVALLVAPAVSQIEEVTSTLTGAPIEYKALAGMRPAVMAMLDALSAKGMDVGDLLYGEPDEDPDPFGEPDEDEDDAVGAPGARGPAGPAVETKDAHPDDEPEPVVEESPDTDEEPDEDEDDSEDGSTVSVDKDEIERELASLRS